MPELLNEFYAVTLTSVYHAKAEGPEFVVKKISLKGKSCFDIGRKLQGGYLLSIGRQLIMFAPECGGLVSDERNIEMVNTYDWGDRTSLIVALFKDEPSARRCFAGENKVPCDPRWAESTKQVLAEIGEEHPVFVICHGEDMELSPTSTSMS